MQTSGAVGMQTMDADLARLVRAGTITRSLAEQRASVPEELKRLLGGAPVAPAALQDAGAMQPPARPAPAAAPPPPPVATTPPPPAPAPPAYTQGG